MFTFVITIPTTTGLLPGSRWQALDEYKSVCHHGTAYTRLEADYADIHSEVTYYVPLNKTYEVWRTKVTNTSDKVRNLSLFGFIEFTNENNYEQDQVNLQYTLFITRTSFEGNKIVQHINENSGKDANGSNWREILRRSGRARFRLQRQPRQLYRTLQNLRRPHCGRARILRQQVQLQRQRLRRTSVRNNARPRRNR